MDKTDRRFPINTLWALIPLDCVCYLPCQINNSQTVFLRKHEVMNHKQSQQSLKKQIDKHDPNCKLILLQSGFLSLLQNGKIEAITHPEHVCRRKVTDENKS